MRVVRPGYRERQDAQVALQAKMQIQYCEQKQRERDEMARVAKKPTQALKLVEALNFVEFATGDYGVSTSPYVNLYNRCAVCWDGTMAAGMEIEEDLTVAPKLETLKKALGKSGKALTLTELPNGRLSVKGEKITVQVPCLTPQEMPATGPDPANWPLNDEIKEAFKSLQGIIEDSGDAVWQTAVLLEANIATATNGKVIMQYRHGIDLPPGLLLPRPFVQAVAKQFKPLIAFGYNPGHSLTFWFEDASWYKTQLYQDAYPNCAPILDVESTPINSPAGLWEGCKEIAEFDDNEWINFKENAIIAGVAKYPVEGLTGGRQFDYKYLKKIIPYIKTIDITTHDNKMIFFGDKVRGVVVGIVHQEEEVAEASE